MLLEAERVGYGASGRSGGQLIPGYACGMAKLAAQLGTADAKRLWDLSVEGVELTRDLIERHRIDCDLAWGHMHVGIKPRQREELLEWQREQEGDYGYGKLRFMERDEVRAVDRERALHRGPPRLRRAATCIRCATRSASARPRSRRASRCTRTAASPAIDHGPTVTVRTENGSVRAKFVALCANVGHVDLSRAAREQADRRRLLHRRDQAARRGARERRSSRTTSRSPTSTGSSTTTGCTADHRLLFGGRVSYSGLDPLGTARATRQRMVNVFPQLADAEIDYAWGGMIDITMSRAPNFGRLEPNVYFLQGYSGHGMVATTIAGKIVAEAIAGQAERFDVFARLKHHDFPGRQAVPPPDARDGDDLVPAEGPDALTRPAADAA